MSSNSTSVCQRKRTLLEDSPKVVRVAQVLRGFYVDSRAIVQTQLTHGLIPAVRDMLGVVRSEPDTPTVSGVSPDFV